jgi:hypothetical protein
MAFAELASAVNLGNLHRLGLAGRRENLTTSRHCGTSPQWHPLAQVHEVKALLGKPAVARGIGAGLAGVGGFRHTAGPFLDDLSIDLA